MLVVVAGLRERRTQEDALDFWRNTNNTMGINHGIGTASDAKFVALETKVQSSSQTLVPGAGCVCVCVRAAHQEGGCGAHQLSLPSWLCCPAAHLLPLARRRVTGG